MEFDRKDVNMNKLVATSLEGKFHVFDMRTQHPTKGFASVSEKVWGDGEFLRDELFEYMLQVKSTSGPKLLSLVGKSCPGYWGTSCVVWLVWLQVQAVKGPLCIPLPAPKRVSSLL